MKTLALVLSLPSALLACGDDDGPGGGGDVDAGEVDAGEIDAGRRDAGFDAGPPPYDAGPFTRIPEAEAAPGREACTFERGAMPWETIGAEHPIGADLPIDHVFVLVLENRSFDHYFGTMPDVDGIPAGATNPDASGAPVAPFHTDDYCIEDVAHGWNASHREWNGGMNDGFVVANDPDGARALGYLTDADVPFYWQLYLTFAMSERHFCSVLGPTWVNRFYVTSGTSAGRISNDGFPEATREAPYVLFQQLDAIGVGWRIYNTDVPFALGGYPDYLGPRLRQLRNYTRLAEDLSMPDALPPVVFIDPSFIAGVEQTDEHPPANPQSGQHFVWELVTAITTSPAWPRSVLIVTYDEHGGFYDHVPPADACPPDDTMPDAEPGRATGTFDHTGFRVPLVVVSPYARRGYVSDRVTDHASVLRFIQARFLLPALTARDANAWPLLDLFDFTAAPDTSVPVMPEPPIDAARMDACRTEFGSGGTALSGSIPPDLARAYAP
jgi:phospholipase C